MKIDIEIVNVAAAKKEHKCAYCEGVCLKGKPYTKLLSRLETERFPVAIPICSSHKPELIPLAIILKR